MEVVYEYLDRARILPKQYREIAVNCRVFDSETLCQVLQSGFQRTMRAVDLFLHYVRIIRIRSVYTNIFQ